MKGDDLCQKSRSAKPSRSYPSPSPPSAVICAQAKCHQKKTTGGRNLFDTAELARVYGDLKINGNPSLSSEPVNDSQMTDNDTPTKIVALLESQNTELKAQLEKAHTENAQLLELATRLQKQNEILMIPPPQPKRRFFTFLRRK